ncbi:hypothetical protein Pelo_7795 [Pelomyxa schiedti]|nr:hypothetical protein Pelo_7795 [Pelomyxa schiedti]
MADTSSTSGAVVYSTTSDSPDGVGMDGKDTSYHGSGGGGGGASASSRSVSVSAGGGRWSPDSTTSVIMSTDWTLKVQTWILVGVIGLTVLTTGLYFGMLPSGSASGVAWAFFIFAAIDCILGSIISAVALSNTILWAIVGANQVPPSTFTSTTIISCVIVILSILFIVFSVILPVVALLMSPFELVLTLIVRSKLRLLKPDEEHLITGVL